MLKLRVQAWGGLNGLIFWGTEVKAGLEPPSCYITSVLVLYLPELHKKTLICEWVRIAT